MPPTPCTSHHHHNALSLSLPLSTSSFSPSPLHPPLLLPSSNFLLRLPLLISPPPLPPAAHVSSSPPPSLQLPPSVLLPYIFSPVSPQFQSSGICFAFLPLHSMASCLAISPPLHSPSTRCDSSSQHSTPLNSSYFSLFLPRSTAAQLQQTRFVSPFLVSTCQSISANERNSPRNFLPPPKAVKDRNKRLIGDVVPDEPSRKDFPDNFLFGFATSAFQWEGELLGGGRGLSIWDTFAQIPGKIKDESVPTIGCNGYNMYKEDIQRAKSIGANAFRISISWSRLLPDGENINPEGLAFYNCLINEIVRQGLTPFVTLYHWDMPLVLENNYQVLGWRTENIVDCFMEYADTCFKHFGDRVKYWITFNDIYAFTIYGYGYGAFAPGRGSQVSGSSAPSGDSSVEPYLVTHNVLLAHAAAANIYRTRYKKEQMGQIGIANICIWFQAYDSMSTDDTAAAQRCLEFQTAWFLDPLITGDYPPSMRTTLGNRLPKFTPEETTSIMGSIDFIGCNYYFANYAQNAATVDPSWWLTDTNAIMSVDGPDGKPIGELIANTTPPMPVYPEGLRNILAWLTKRYGGKLPIYITGNGCADNPENAPLDDQETRIMYFKEHLQCLATAINDDKCNVKGYMIWSLLDNWEWSCGYTARFGCYYTNYGDEINRIPKASVAWLTSFLNGSAAPG